MQALRNFRHPQVAEALKKIATHDPDRGVRMRALDLLDEMTRRDPGSAAGGTVRNEAMAVRSVEGELKLHTYLISTRNSGASDFHLSVGQPPIVRMAADLLRAQGEPFTAKQTESMLREILTEPQWAVLKKEQQVDFCYLIPQGRSLSGQRVSRSSRLQRRLPRDPRAAAPPSAISACRRSWRRSPVFIRASC